MEFQVNKMKNGRWRWELYDHENGSVRAYGSGGYIKREDADNEVDTIEQAILNASAYYKPPEFIADIQKQLQDALNKVDHRDEAINRLEFHEPGESQRYNAPYPQPERRDAYSCQFTYQ